MNFAKKLIEMKEFFPEEFQEQNYVEPRDEALVRALNSPCEPESGCCDECQSII